MTIKEFKIQNALGTLSNKYKWQLAGNPNTPEVILKVLSTDKDWYVKATAVNNLKENHDY